MIIIFGKEILSIGFNIKHKKKGTDIFIRQFSLKTRIERKKSIAYCNYQKESSSDMIEE